MKYEEWLDEFIESSPNKYAMKIGIKEMKSNDAWIEYVLTHDNKDWSSKQKIVVDAGLDVAQSIDLTRKEYLRIKGEPFED